MARKPESDTARGKLIAIRMTDTEHEQFAQAAERDGKPLSVWFRWLAEKRAKAKRQSK